MKNLFMLLALMPIMHAHELQKIELHQAPVVSSVEKVPYLEQGKLVLYFNDAVPIAAHEQRAANKKGWAQKEYRFDASLSTQAQKALAHVVVPKEAPYQLKLQQVQTPTPAVQLVVHYNPKDIDCDLQTFDAITGQKGVVVRFINKPLLQQLTEFERPLLQTAMAKRVVIDCGHGGDDPGTIGCNQAREKDVTLQVGLQLAHLLRKRGFQVTLTREQDQTLRLHERTYIANSAQPALFISLHANSAANAQAQGIETYCLHSKLFKDAHGSGQSMKQHLAALYEQSNQFAKSVHNSMLSFLTQQKNEVQDRHVRHSVSQVLLGANMPSALVELGFLSHQHEASRLVDKTYQHTLAQGICEGIVSYISATASV